MLPSSLKKNVAVYTCSINNYDNFLKIQRATKDIDFIFFTNKLNNVPTGWKGRQLKSPPRLKNNHDINRFHKIFSHIVLPEYKYSIYIDGNINFNGSFFNLVEKLIAANVAIAAFKHPESRKLDEEAVACQKYNKFDSYDCQTVIQQLSTYESEGLDLSQIITANYLLVRNHNYTKLRLCMSLWWSQLFEYSKRDQMSLSYALWKTNLPWAFLDEDFGINPKLLSRHSHKKNRLEFFKKFRNLLKKDLCANTQESNRGI